MHPDNFFERYKPRDSDSSIKHEVLKRAIITAIEDGYWKDGDKLPTEKVLAAITPFSLGTVQKAIGSLVQEGMVRRKRGLGTFIVPVEKRMGAPWIYQALSADGTRFIPMASRVLVRREVESTELWSIWLRQGGEGGRILRLDRLVITDEGSFVSRFHVDSGRFPFFAEAPLSRLHGENFVKLTQDIYRMSPRRISTTVSSVATPIEVRKVLGKAATRYCTMIEIAADSAQGSPLFYNQLFVPANGPKLHFQEPRTS